MTDKEEKVFYGIFHYDFQDLITVKISNYSVTFSSNCLMTKYLGWNINAYFEIYNHIPLEWIYYVDLFGRIMTAARFCYTVIFILLLNLYKLVIKHISFNHTMSKWNINLIYINSFLWAVKIKDKVNWNSIKALAT